jgi:hypothetical protein
MTLLTRRLPVTLLAASVLVSGGLLSSFMAPARAITSIDELSDTNTNHWAYEALRDLVEKYDVIEGYPSGVFRGNKAPTRYEMAAALNALIKTIGKDLVRLGAEKANKVDLEAVARLQQEFRAELEALSQRATNLENRASAIEAKNDEQDNRLTLLEKTQIHGDMTFGLLADMAGSGVDRLNGGSPDGTLDAISNIGRLRLSLAVPIKEDTDEGYLGRGDLYARLISAWGREQPLGAQPNNAGSFQAFNSQSIFARDASANNEGGNGNGRLRINTYLEHMYYKQHVNSGVPLLSNWYLGDKPGWENTGDLYVGVVPWWFLFDKSPYRGDTVDRFQNAAFFNTPGTILSRNMPTVAYAWHQGLGENTSLDLTSAIATVDAGDVNNGLNATYEARLNYHTGFISDSWNKPGSLYVGGFNVWQAGSRSLSNTIVSGAVDRTGVLIGNSDNRDNTNALYAGWNQEWYKGIGTSVSYLLSNNSNSSLALGQTGTFFPAVSSTTASTVRTSAHQALSAVLSVPMSALGTWREKDEIGVGYAFVDFNNPNNTQLNNQGEQDANNLEQVVETYYRVQVGDHFSVVPSVQLIMNSFGMSANNIRTLVGVRTNYTF